MSETYDMTSATEQVHRYERQEGNRLICVIPAHHDSITIRTDQMLTKGKDGRFEITNVEIA